MSTSDSEGVVDHVSDLSSAKGPIFFLSFLFLETDLLLWSGNFERSYSEQKQSSRPASQSEGNPYLQLIAMMLIHPLTRPSPLLGSITLPPRENRNKNLLGFWISSSNMKTLKMLGICQIEAPRSEVFVDQPRNSVGVTLLLERKNSWSMVFLQISAME